MAARRHFYNTRWYAKFERAFTDALSIRYQMILIDEAVLPAPSFVATVFAAGWQAYHIYKHEAALVQIVNAVDKRAK